MPSLLSCAVKSIVEQVRFFNPFADIAQHKTVLPHWEQPGATYFVTFRLADSLPAGKVAELQSERDSWLQQHRKPWSSEVEQEFHERFSTRVEQWLDSGHGSCALREPQASTIVGDALSHFDGQRCVQHAWVVMPNHVHVLFTLLNGETLEKLLHSWKSYTAKKLSSEPVFWQRDYFDRLIRNEEHFANCVRYIRRNPVKAKLRAGDSLSYEADWIRAAVS